ncbi:MAG: hypothetical protein ACE5J7_02940 [Candidatus Aenigmatarchaeota archaeon]
MAIYSDTDFRKNRKLRFSPRLKRVGPSSQDLHIGRLYKQKHLEHDITTSDGWLNYLKEIESIDSDVPWTKFRTGLEKEPTMKRDNEDVWVLRPGRMYLAESIEKITLPKGLGVDVDTRSSWARYGVRVEHVDDELKGFSGYKGHIPLMIVSCDTPVVLRPRDRICQAIVYDERGKGILGNNGIFEAITNKEIECYKLAMFNPKIKLPSINIDRHSIHLTLNPNIKRFNDKIIDPKEDLSGKYLDINITGGYEIPYKKFFLGSSNEILRIGKKHVALLREIFTSPERVRTHSNAGYVDPGFEGTITLEQFVVPDGPNTIYPDMKMGEVEICRLKSPCTKPYKSKYSGQFGATASKGHLDFKKKKRKK